MLEIASVSQTKDKVRNNSVDARLMLTMDFPKYLSVPRFSHKQNLILSHISVFHG